MYLFFLAEDAFGFAGVDDFEDGSSSSKPPKKAATVGFEDDEDDDEEDDEEGLSLYSNTARSAQNTQTQNTT